MSKLETLERKLRSSKQQRALCVLWPGDELTPETKVTYSLRGERHECSLAELEKRFPQVKLDILRVEYVEN